MRFARSRQKRRRLKAVAHSIPSRQNGNRSPPGPNAVEFFALSRQRQQRFLHRRLSTLFMSILHLIRFRFFPRQRFRSCRQRSTPGRLAQRHSWNCWGACARTLRLSSLKTRTFASRLQGNRSGCRFLVRKLERLPYKANRIRQTFHEKTNFNADRQRDDIRRHNGFCSVRANAKSFATGPTHTTLHLPHASRDRAVRARAMSQMRNDVGADKRNEAESRTFNAESRTCRASNARRTRDP